jgi:hypothetical protein
MRLTRRRCSALLIIAATTRIDASPSTPRITFVQPSGTEIPANLLRVSVRFAAPIEGRVLSRITLLNPDGTPIQGPFLAQELWSPDGKVLTFLLHPGRVKSGLQARATWGPILIPGGDVCLAFDGHPIKCWRIRAADEAGPVPSAWTLSAVTAKSLQPLVVTFDTPIDGQDADYFGIADADGRRVPGRGRLSAGEHAWTFTPGSPWRAGTYKLVVRGTLEDAAGNRLASRFETSVDTPPASAVDAVIPFAALSSHWRDSP